MNKPVKTQRIVNASLIALCIAIAGCSNSQQNATDESNSNELINKPRLSEALANRNFEEQSIKLIQPVDSQEVTSPVMFEIETKNLELAPKGRSEDGQGHFHISIDHPCIEAGRVIIEQPDTVHVGDGSDTKEVDLEPGEHTICAQIGDGFHTATNLVDEITITVVES